MRLKTYLLVLVLLNVQATQSIAQLAGSLNFNGTDNYVEIAESPLHLIQAGDFTFEALIQGQGTNQNAHPVLFSNRGENAFGGGIMVFLHDIWGGSSVKMLCFQVNATNYLFVNNGTFDGDILDGQCHHIAISRSGSTLAFYIDGMKIGERSIPIIADISLDTPLWIGKDQATNNTFHGTISQCRIWEVARSQSEIDAHKDLSLGGDEAGLLAYWEMDNEGSQLVSDRMGQFDGTLRGSEEVDPQDPSWSEEGCLGKVGELDCSFTVAPNPTFGPITVQQEMLTNGNLEIFNSIGQSMSTVALNSANAEVDLSNLPSGIYVLRRQVGECLFTEKVVKQ